MHNDLGGVGYRVHSACGREVTVGSHISQSAAAELPSVSLKRREPEWYTVFVQCHGRRVCIT